MALFAGADDDVSRDRSRGARGGPQARGRACRAARMAAGPARRRRAGRRPLSRQPRRSLLLLQVESVCAHRPGDVRSHRLRYQLRRSRGLPPGTARGGRARCRASLCRVGHRQDCRVRARRGSRPRRSGTAARAALPREPRGNRNRHRARTISRSSTPWRRASPRASDAKRCSAAA